MFWQLEGEWMGIEVLGKAFQNTIFKPERFFY